jgi:hypothetical protein
MSFAGPADPMLRQMLSIANGRGIMLIAAVGDAGPTSPPLYPGADAGVIGVTATKRGPQVAEAAPWGGIFAAAPGGKYQVTSGKQPMSAGLQRCCWRRNRSSLRRKCAAISPGPRIAFPGRAMKSGQVS